MENTEAIQEEFQNDDFINPIFPPPSIFKLPCPPHSNPSSFFPLARQLSYDSASKLELFEALNCDDSENNLDKKTAAVFILRDIAEGFRNGCITEKERNELKADLVQGKPVRLIRDEINRILMAKANIVVEDFEERDNELIRPLHHRTVPIVLSFFFFMFSTSPSFNISFIHEFICQ